MNGALTIDSSYTFPITDGANGQVLATDGNGTLSWGDNTAGFISEDGITHSAINDDDFIFGADSINFGGSGAENKFFYDKDKGAFRAGSIGSTNWDIDSLGFFSFAVGNNVKASGDIATAFGYSTAATGLAATAFGGLTTCLLYTSPSPRDLSTSRMPSSA